MPLGAGGVNRSVSGLPESKRTTRAETLADLKRMETPTLEDIEVDLSMVDVPEAPPGERLSQQQLDAFVERFVASLKEEGRTR